MTTTPLPRSFYACDTHAVARALLGKILVRRWRNNFLVGRICDVESYVGQDDAACHAAKGRTARTEIMFGEAGHAYVYLIYGMHYCFNVVTDRKDFPAAVLIRSVLPITKITRTTDGPGKLTQAMHITRAQNNEDLATSQSLFISDDGVAVPDHTIQTSPRINVDYAGDDARLPWRYFYV